MILVVSSIHRNAFMLDILGNKDGSFQILTIEIGLFLEHNERLKDEILK